MWFLPGDEVSMGWLPPLPLRGVGRGGLLRGCPAGTATGPGARSGPERNSVPQITAPAPKMAAVTGARRPLPPDVDQAAYRIVQEALTNVTRHAGDARASVRLHYTPDVLNVQVDDDGKGTVTGAGTRPPGPGLGLIGMRERVSALGGRLHAGPQDGGGFQVRAELPARAPA